MSILKLNRAFFLNAEGNFVFSRSFATHWDPKYRKLRAQKIRKAYIDSFFRKFGFNLIYNKI